MLKTMWENFVVIFTVVVLVWCILSLFHVVPPPSFSFGEYPVERYDE